MSGFDRSNFKEKTYFFSAIIIREKLPPRYMNGVFTEVPPPDNDFSGDWYKKVLRDIANSVNIDESCETIHLTALNPL
jgi:hypothetical protein